MSQQQRQLVQILSWVQTLEKVTQSISIIMNALICIRLLWVGFTKCDFIVFDFDLLQKCRDNYSECSFNGLVVYTTMAYAVIELIYCLYKIFARSSQIQQSIQDQMTDFEFKRIFMIVAVHQIFVCLWHFERIEYKEFTFKNIQEQRLCLRSLYSSIFWILLFTDLTVCITILAILIKIFQIYLNGLNNRDLRT